MIRHVSLDVDDPRAAAAALAELLGGTTVAGIPFPDSVTALAGDPHGTAIECLARGTRLRIPGPAVDSHTPAWSGFHAAVSVDRSEAEIAEIAARAGWPCRRRAGGPFDVVEVWIDGRHLLEALPPEETARYVAALGRLAALGHDATHRGR